MDKFSGEKSDVDVLVSSADIREAFSLLSLTAQSLGWLIAGVRYHEQVNSILFVLEVEKGRFEAIKIDLCPGLGWYGVCNARLDSMFLRSINSSHTSADETRVMRASANVLQKFMSNGCLTEKEWSRVIDDGVVIDEIAEIFARLGVGPNKSELITRKITRLRQWALRAQSGGVNSYIDFGQWFLQVIGSHVKYKSGLSTQSGMVAYLRCDSHDVEVYVEQSITALYSIFGDKSPTIIYSSKAYETNCATQLNLQETRSKIWQYMRDVKKRVWIKWASMRGGLVLDFNWHEQGDFKFIFKHLNIDLRESVITSGGDAQHSIQENGVNHMSKEEYVYLGLLLELNKYYARIIESRVS